MKILALLIGLFLKPTNHFNPGDKMVVENDDEWWDAIA